MQGGTAMNSPLSDLFGQSDKCKVVQRYAPLSEYFRRGAFILLMVMSDKSGWYRAGAPLHGYFPWRCFFIFKSGGPNEFQ